MNLYTLVVRAPTLDRYHSNTSVKLIDPNGVEIDLTNCVQHLSIELGVGQITTATIQIIAKVEADVAADVELDATNLVVQP